MDLTGFQELNPTNTRCTWRQDPPRCYCGKKTTVMKSWSFQNPGRRFARCDTHGFYQWCDEEPPHGWQREAILEARDEIWRLNVLVRNLKEARATGSSTSVRASENEIDSISKVDAKDALSVEAELLVVKEKEKLMRQVLVISWVGFVAVTGVIIQMLK